MPDHGDQRLPALIAEHYRRDIAAVTNDDQSRADPGHSGLRQDNKNSHHSGFLINLLDSLLRSVGGDRAHSRFRWLEAALAVVRR